MAYPTYEQPQTPQTRPTTVAVSSYLLYLTAAVGLISAVLSLTQVSTISDVYRDAYSGTTNDGVEAVIVGTTVVGVVINILFAAGLAILAIFNNRGRQGSRITTWVIGGISLCCSGVGLAGTAVTGSITSDTGNGPSASEVRERLADALPSWYTPLTVTLSVISLLAILGAIILLALPASNAFFRRPAQAGWDPSTPYPQQQPPYPGQSPYPQYPGQQQYSGQPPYPGQAPQQPPTAPGSPYGPPSGPPAGPPSAPPSGPPSAPPPAPPSGDDPQNRPS